METGDGALLERGSEATWLLDAVARLRTGRSSAAVVLGEAGIGKTSLLQLTAAAASRSGVVVLAARGHDLERDQPYSFVRRLLTQHVARLDAELRTRVLGGPAAAASSVLTLSGSAGLPAAAGTARESLFWLLANVAEIGPLLLVADDLHWADVESQTFVLTVMSRLEELEVLLIVGTRPPDASADHAVLQRILTSDLATVLAPAPLSPGAVAALTGERLGRRVSRAFAAACHTATGGNPFLLQELCTTLAADGWHGSDEESPRVAAITPESIRRSLLVRLQRMPSAAADLAAAVAVLDTDADLGLAAAMASLPLERAAEAVDALVAGGLFAAGPALSFVHPVVRQTVRSDLAPGRRALLHAAAARNLQRRSADPEKVAAHLLLCPGAGDADRQQLLATAAAAALRRGAPGAAVDYLERALSEAAGPGSDSLLLALGRAEHLVGRDEAAAHHLEQAIERTDDPSMRCEAWLLLARVTAAHVDTPAAVAVLERALADLPDRDESSHQLIEAELLALGITHAHTYPATVRRIEALPELGARSAAECLMLATVALRRCHDGSTVQQVSDLCDRALADPEALVSAGTAALAVTQLMYALALADRPDDARPLVDAMLTRARREGSVSGVVSGLGTRATLRWFAGDVAGCEADARQAVEVVGSLPHAEPWVCGLHALALVERRELDDAEVVLARGGIDLTAPPVVQLEMPLYARARLRYAQRRYDDALEDLTTYAERAARIGSDNPTVPWRAGLALIHYRRGDMRRCEATLHAYVDAADAWGSATARGLARRTLGSLTADVDVLREAVALLAASPSRLEHARALVDLGEVLRRSGERNTAQLHLREAARMADASGAVTVRERAHEELAHMGVRARRLTSVGVESLTPSERRVASLAASGLSNRGVARELFVSPKTVENHLGQVYAKLGISRRSQLPGLDELAGERDALA